MTTARREPDWDPLAPEVLDDQRRAHDEMRERCPVAWSEFLGWSLFKYEDVLAAVRDPATFGNHISGSPDGETGAVASIPLQLDPPEHTPYKRFLITYFSTERMSEFEPRSRELAASLLRSYLHTGGDAVAAFTDPYPVQSLCAFLGWPADDWRRLKTWSSEIERAALRRDPAMGRRATEAFYAYIQSFIDARRDDPREDVTTWLLESERIEGVALDDERKRSILRLLLHAGHGTTTASLGLCILYLAKHSEVQSHLRAHPGAIAAASEEILRHDGPLMSMPRLVRRDCELRGRTLTAGDRVALMYAAADRDPDAFGDADRCVIGRSPNRHLIFGNGLHFCLGARLARLELRIALEELLARTGSFTLANEDPRRYRWPGNGPRSLPLAIEAA
ncbi:MAG TPA: cytochrome P450 [Solirubrobacteraceae bacterium]|nr:cytochrome P450 [Solirubrobacteraceae bacterium]